MAPGYAIDLVLNLLANLPELFGTTSAESRNGGVGVRLEPFGAICRDSVGFSTFSKVIKPGPRRVFVEGNHFQDAIINPSSRDWVCFVGLIKSPGFAHCFKFHIFHFLALF
jgi:hypothetical protein